MLAIARPAEPTVVLVLISSANLALLAIAAIYRDERDGRDTQPVLKRGLLSLSLVASSQVVYLLFGAAWFFDWMSFYPGNPVENCAILGGLLLCVVGAITAFKGSGLTRSASLIGAAIMTALWFLAAAASVAV